MLLKLGSKGSEVKALQGLLGQKADGVFGKITEQAVKEFQKTYGLITDGIVGDKTWAILNEQQGNTSLIITKLPINVHITRKAGREIKYLVIHYTAGGSSKAGSAKNNRNIFLKRKASADYIVDDTEVVQVNPDLRNYYCWAVGDGGGKYGITNANSINIEMCSTLKSGTSSSKPNHEGWSISDAVLTKTAELSRYLMQAYNIPIERVVRHYDASRKSCPGIIGWNDGVLYDVKGNATGKNNSQEWSRFKARLIS